MLKNITFSYVSISQISSEYCVRLSGYFIIFQKYLSTIQEVGMAWEWFKGYDKLFCKIREGERWEMKVLGFRNIGLKLRWCSRRKGEVICIIEIMDGIIINQLMIEHPMRRVRQLWSMAWVMIVIKRIE